MAWDDSDDDWEKEDLKLDLGDAKPKEEEWSDEEGHDAHLKEDPASKPQAPKPQAPKELTGLALKIAEREKKEAEEAERKAALRKELGHDDAALDVSDVDAATAEKIRRKHMEEASDLDAAIDAFGVSGASDAKKPAAAPPAAASSKAAAAPKPAAAPAPAVSKEDAARVAAREAAALGGVAMEDFEAKSDAEFEKLAKLINAKLAPSEGKKGHMVCLKALLRLATTNMDTEQCKELASFVTVLSNDKIKAEREKDKKKTTAKKKGKINIASNKGTDFDDIGLDNHSGGGRGWSGGGGGRDDDYDFM